MPSTLKRLEFGIYHIYVYGASSYSDFEAIADQALTSRAASGEIHQVFIIEREANSTVDINFAQIRQLASQHDIRKTHFLHIEVSTAIHVFVAGINRSLPLNIQMIRDMDAAIDEGRDMLSRYTQPRRPKDL